MQQIRSRRGTRQARIGAFVRRANEATLSCLIPTYLAPAELAGTSAAQGSLLEIADENDRGSGATIGSYAPCSHLFMVARVPRTAEVAEETVHSEPVAAISSELIGSKANFGDALGSGTVRNLDGPLWLSVGEDEPRGYHGLIEIGRDHPGDAWPTIEDVGAPVSVDRGLLLGFIAALDEASCIVAPAATIFTDRSLTLASCADIAAHNAEAFASPDVSASDDVVPQAFLSGFKSFGRRVARASATFGRAAGATT